MIEIAIQIPINNANARLTVVLMSVQGFGFCVQGLTFFWYR
jgi:hypothetical protein